MNKLMQTTNDWSAFILRLTLGIVIFPHGAQKLLGWFGGGGFSGTMGFLTSAGIPSAIAFLIIMGESLGAVAIILGLMTRLCAASIAIIMLGAIFLVHLKNGFFMNWMGQQAGEGFEYHLLAIGICLALVILGGGKFSVDKFLSSKSS
ncbi:MAG: DoxX family protein [Candidatus Omnitrophota bacterium]|nr:DoxX family protein [Candidatus Omnitrophota bacterium]